MTYQVSSSSCIQINSKLADMGSSICSPQSRSKLFHNLSFELLQALFKNLSEIDLARSAGTNRLFACHQKVYADHQNMQMEALLQQAAKNKDLASQIKSENDLDRKNYPIFIPAEPCRFVSIEVNEIVLQILSQRITIRKEQAGRGWIQPLQSRKETNEFLKKVAGNVENDFNQYLESRDPHRITGYSRGNHLFFQWKTQNNRVCLTASRPASCDMHEKIKCEGWQRDITDFKVAGISERWVLLWSANLKHQCITWRVLNSLTGRQVDQWNSPADHDPCSKLYGDWALIASLNNRIDVRHIKTGRSYPPIFVTNGPIPNRVDDIQVKQDCIWVVCSYKSPQAKLTFSHIKFIPLPNIALPKPYYELLVSRFPPSAGFEEKVKRDCPPPAYHTVFPSAASAAVSPPLPPPPVYPVCINGATPPAEGAIKAAAAKTQASLQPPSANASGQRRLGSNVSKLMAKFQGPT